MPPFGINPPQPLDFRYPGTFNLNQTPKLPNSFGPPDMASMFQSGISGLADPIVAGMKEAQAAPRRPRRPPKPGGPSGPYTTAATRLARTAGGTAMAERDAGLAGRRRHHGHDGRRQARRDQSRGPRQLYEHDEGRRAQ